MLIKLQHRHNSNHLLALPSSWKFWPCCWNLWLFNLCTSAQHTRLKLDSMPWIPGAWVYLRSEACQRQAHEWSCSCCMVKLLVMMPEHTKPSWSVDFRSGTDTDTGVADVRMCLVCVLDWVFMMQNCSRVWAMRHEYGCLGLLVSYVQRHASLGIIIPSITSKNSADTTWNAVIIESVEVV